MLMNDEAITVMVEDFWRSFIPVAFGGNQEGAAKIVMSFQASIDQMAAILPADERKSFVERVEAKRGELYEEYNRGPAALKQRLGILDPSAAQPAPRQRMGLGEVAVKTAIRATIWESVILLFRAFR